MPVVRTFLRSRAGLALACWCVATLAFADEPAITKRATELREQPGAGKSTPLAAQTQVLRLTERQGPYVQVKTSNGATGWVHLFDLGPTTASANTATDSGSGALRGVTGLFTRSGNTTVATSNVGVRGLSAEDLAKASPNPAAVGQMETLRASEQDARSFARGASLAVVDVAPLPSPRAPANNANRMSP